MWRCAKEQELRRTLQQQLTAKAPMVSTKEFSAEVAVLYTCATKVASIREIWDTELAHAPAFFSELATTAAATAAPEVVGSSRAASTAPSHFDWATREAFARRATAARPGSGVLRRMARETLFVAGQGAVSPSNLLSDSRSPKEVGR